MGVNKVKINKNFLNLKDSYLFSTISKKVVQYKKEHPEKEIISMGIGDVTLPLCEAVINAMQAAVSDMGKKEGFKGYGPEQGYDFLRKAICNYYNNRNISLMDNEIFISDGAKSDLGNILDIFEQDSVVLIPDPVYPVYVDTNIMAGRKILYMDANEDNNFLPMPVSSIKADIIYLCSPNNPTGAVYNRSQLEAWVEYAILHKAVILFDAAYEAFVQDEELPKSIFEIEEAKKCAIEFCSLSKTAGFTGTRCGYTIVPNELVIDNISLNNLWLRRQTTKFNGVSYIIQRGAEAVFTDDGYEQTRKFIKYYLENAKVISDTLKKIGIWFVGGENSPYIWLKCPNGMNSWEYFDYLLENANVVGTPGEGFGKNGEGFFRFTSFGNRDDIITAMKRIETIGF